MAGGDLSGLCWDYRVLVMGEEVPARCSFCSVFVETGSKMGRSKHSEATHSPAVADTVIVGHSDVDVKDCPDAAHHRVHLYNLPGTTAAEWEPYVASRALADVNLCVLVFACPRAEEVAPRSDGGPSPTRSPRAVRLRAAATLWDQVQRDCEGSGARLLVLLDNWYAATADEESTGGNALPATPSARYLYIETAQISSPGMEDAVEATRTALRELHRDRIAQRALEQERKRLMEEGVPAVSDEAVRLPPPPSGWTFASGLHSNPVFTFDVVLLGPAASGKSVFIASAVDDCVLPTYEPTRRPDVGTFHVRFDRGRSTANVRLHDGPVRSLAATAHAVLLFVDLSQDGSIQPLHDILATTEIAAQATVTLVGTEDAAGPALPTEEADMHDLARSIGARATTVDPRRANIGVLLSVTAGLVDHQQGIRRQMHRLAVEQSERARAPVSFFQLRCHEGSSNATEQQQSS